MAKRGLGRGLNALIPQTVTKEAVPTTEAPAPGVSELPVQMIHPSPWQPRQTFDQDRLQELAESIRVQGLVQPVAVRKRGDEYELVAGERRWRAVQLLEMERIPAVVLDASDQAVREMALVENLQRADLNPIEIAQAYRSLQEDLGLTHEAIALRLGVSRASVTNTLRLADLPEEVKSLIAGGELSAGHGRALLSLADPLSQIRLARKIVKERISVRQAERLAGETAARAKKSKPVDTVKAPEIRDLEERLARYLGTRVRIEDRDGKGEIRAAYYSPEDAARLVNRMGLPDELSES